MLQKTKQKLNNRTAATAGFALAALSETKRRISVVHGGDVYFFAQRTPLAAREALYLTHFDCMTQRVPSVTFPFYHIKCFNF